MAIAAVVSYPVGGDPPDSAPIRVPRAVPDVDIEVESLVPLGETVPVYFWGRSEEFAELERVLEGEPTVTELRTLEQVEDGTLYSVEWDIDDPLIACINRADGALLDAYGDGEEWEFTIWFERDESTAPFQECCERRDVPMRVERLLSMSEVVTETAPALTADQREAIVTAFEHGYFEDPRKTTQEELADVLGIWPTAVSSLLRRGLENLVEHSLRE